MANVLIYIGLSFLIVASLIALIAAIKGWLLSQKLKDKHLVKISLTKYTKPAIIITIIGFIFTGIGIMLSLN